MAAAPTRLARGHRATTRPMTQYMGLKTTPFTAPRLVYQLSVADRRRAPSPLLRAAERDTDASTRVPDAAPTRNGSVSANGASSSVGSDGAAAPAEPQRVRGSSNSSATSSQEEEGFSWGSFLAGPLPGKLAALVGLIVVSRIGVYVRLPGVDVDAFSSAMQSNGLLGYVDALSGGSISKVRVGRACIT